MYKVIVVCIVAAVTAVGVVVASSGAQAPGPRTIVLKENEKGSKFKFIDVKPLTKNERPGMGDSFIFYTPLSDASGKKVGELDAKCMVAKPKPETDVCEGVVHLGDGDLFLAARVVGEGNVTGAITGGTGAYVGARGSFTSVGENNSIDTFTILP
jgi:hypothetical protein